MSPHPLRGSLGQGELPAQTREQITLTVGQTNSCNYCLSAHTAIGKTVGLTPEQIRDARYGTAIDSKSDAVLKFVTQLLQKRGAVSDSDFAAVRDADVNDAEITEIIANTALNLFTNYFNHVAETEVDFPAVEELKSVTDNTTCSTGTCSV